MGRKQRSYQKNLKSTLSKLVVQDGRKQVDVSRELGVPYDTLQKWVADYRKKLKEGGKEAKTDS